MDIDQLGDKIRVGRRGRREQFDLDRTDDFQRRDERRGGVG
jgi:hypothetical protein